MRDVQVLCSIVDKSHLQSTEVCGGGGGGEHGASSPRVAHPASVDEFPTVRQMACLVRSGLYVLGSGIRMEHCAMNGTNRSLSSWTTYCTFIRSMGETSVVYEA